MKLVLVDDHVLFREGLASLLRSQPDIKLVGMASTVQDAVQIVFQETPDIVLMDFQLSDCSGVE